MAPRAVSRQMLRSQVLEQVEEAIVSGQLRPGERINEVALSAQMDVSRGTLREALRSFEQAGLLVSRANRGTYVRVISPDDAGEIFELMGIIEGRAVRRALNLDHDALIREARERLEVLEQVVADPAATMQARQDADLGFHEAVSRLSGSEILADSWLRQRGLVLSVVVNAGEPIISELQADSHRELLEVIERGSVDEAERVFHSHWRDAGDAIVATMKAAAVDELPLASGDR